MKNRFVAAAAAAMLLLLSACGAPPAPSPSQEPAASSGETETPSAPLEESARPAAIRVAALKGPTAMGMVKLMEDGEKGETAGDYLFTLAGAADEITGKIVQGEFDIAAVPTNLAATLYHKTEGAVQMAAINTLGVLYLVEAGDTIHSVSDLRGKTVYTSGKGQTPEFVLNYILTQNGLTPGVDVTVEFKNEHAEIASLLSAGQAQVAMLPQPFVTSALHQNENLRVALNLTEEWDGAAGGESQLVMGCILVQKEFAREQPQALAAFLEEYRASVEYVNAPGNLEAAAGLIEKYGIVKAEVAREALPKCNIVLITGEEMRMARGFYQVLFDADPKSVGGKLPDDGLYYVG